MNLNIKSVFFCLRQRRNTLSRKAMAARLSIRVNALLPGRDPCAFLYRIKSGVMGVTRLMANEWAKHNINLMR